MKLKELLEADIKTIPGKHEAGLTKPKQVSRGIKLLGSGMQGSAFKHPHIPNTVIKTAKVRTKNPDDNPYVAFVKLSLDHQDNPFFPRIYNAVLRQLKEPDLPFF